MSARLLATVCLLLALAAPAVLMVAIDRYRPDVPTEDYWDFLDFLDRVSQKGFLHVDHLEQTNEHRLAVPRLVMLAMAHVGGMDLRFDAAAALLAAAGTLLALLCLIRGIGLWGWLALPGTSALVFSMSIWGNWLNFGAPLAVLLNVLCVSWGLVLLTADRLSWKGLAGAAALGASATFSFASALIIWPLGFALLAKRRDGLPCRAALAVWTLVAAAVAYLYASGYYRPLGHPLPWLFFSEPGEFLRFLGTVLGTPLGPWPVEPFGPLWALAAGAAGTILFAVLAARAASAGERGLSALGVYAIASAVLFAAGRQGMGLERAFAPHYRTQTSLLWMALLGLLAHALARGRWRPAAAAALLTISFLGCFASALSIRRYPAEAAPYRAARQAILETARGAPWTPEHAMRCDPLFPPAHGDEARFRRGLEIMMRHRLWIYRSDSKRAVD